ncbi:MAG: hypothetical protein WAX89_03370, partial [Alphaproteobacteria bacterium]
DILHTPAGYALSMVSIKSYKVLPLTDGSKKCQKRLNAWAGQVHRDDFRADLQLRRLMPHHSPKLHLLDVVPDIHTPAIGYVLADGRVLAGPSATVYYEVAQLMTYAGATMCATQLQHTVIALQEHYGNYAYAWRVKALQAFYRKTLGRMSLEGAEMNAHCWSEMYFNLPSAAALWRN